MSTLSACIDKLKAQHGGLRALGRAAGLDAGYLSRLGSEQKTEPSSMVLAALGIERVVTYRLSKKPATPITHNSRGTVEDDCAPD